jgi:DNA modification methylase
MGWVKGQQPPDYGLGNGERTQTTVWEIGTVSQADRKEFNHSTPKPVGLFTIPIVKHLKPGEICYEPFAGSGPQFIAAEQLGRRCFGMELSPQFVDVIVTRWQRLTGKKAILSPSAPEPAQPPRKPAATSR